MWLQGGRRFLSITVVSLIVDMSLLLHPSARLSVIGATKIRPLQMKIHQLQSADSKNPPTAKC